MAVDRILAGLNDAQREAVTHDAGPLLIVAGAGTGKTTVITRRIAWLIAQRRARPEEILALTFTDKAAAEMEERVDQLVPYGYADVEIATFHAFGDSLLRGHSLEIGLKNDFSVLAGRSRSSSCAIACSSCRWRATVPSVIRHAICRRSSRSSAAARTRTSRRPTTLAVRRSSARRPGRRCRYQEGRDRAEGQVELAAAYATYQDLMAREGNIDFGDQIILALHLLRQRAHVLNFYQRAVQIHPGRRVPGHQLRAVRVGASCWRAASPQRRRRRRRRSGHLPVARGGHPNVLGFLEHYDGAGRSCSPTTSARTRRSSTRPIALIVYNNPDRLEVRSGIDKHLARGARAAGSGAAAPALRDGHPGGRRESPQMIREQRARRASGVSRRGRARALQRRR